MESQRVGRDWVTNPFILSLKKENEEVELSIWLKKFYEKEWLNKTNGRETKVTNMNKTEIVEMQNRKKKKRKLNKSPKLALLMMAGNVGNNNKTDKPLVHMVLEKWTKCKYVE